MSQYDFHDGEYCGPDRDPGPKYEVRAYGSLADGDGEPTWQGNDLADAFSAADQPNDSRDFVIWDLWLNEIVRP